MTNTQLQELHMETIPELTNNAQLLPSTADQQETFFGEGVLDAVEGGFGFLRRERYLPGPLDVYVSASQIRRFGFRQGHLVPVHIPPQKGHEQYAGLLRVESVNGLDPEVAMHRPHFDAFTPIFPRERSDMETGPANLSGRLINLVLPIGRGHGGWIFSPPHPHKTLLRNSIANAIT